MTTIPNTLRKKRREQYEKEKELGIDRKKSGLKKIRLVRKYVREYTKSRAEEDLQFRLIVNHRKKGFPIFSRNLK